MQISIITLFPSYFSSVLNSSILGRAAEKGLVSIAVIDLRQFATDKHRITDDRPYGGGPGMVLKVEPIYEALKSLAAGPWFRKPGDAELTVLTSAKGELFDQQQAKHWQAAYQRLTIICGHYEGVDERVSQHLVDQEIRIGDYVLTGGEPAAAVMVDAVSRLVPQVLGNESSNQDESHTVQGQLGFPQYTRPETFQDWAVPSVLLSGDHAQITAWRAAKRKQQEADV